MNGKNVSANEFQLRVNEMTQLLLDGYSRPEILELCSSWGNKRTIDRYRAAALVSFKEANAGTIEDKKDFILTGILKLLRKAKDDPKETHKLFLSLAKLYGLDKLTITHMGHITRSLKDVSEVDLSKVLEPNEED